MNKKKILKWMAHADRMKNPIRRYYKTVICLFDQPSPILWSFQAAAIKLGCHTITLPENQVALANHFGEVVIMNPDASKNNPMDRLAELYALSKELEVRNIELDSTDRDPIRVVFVGEGPSVKPFIELLNYFPKIEYHFISMEDIVKDLQEDPHLLEDADVFYLSEGVFSKSLLNKTKPSSILMRTYPFESSPEVHYNARCIYLSQETHGVHLRMALLDEPLSKKSLPSLYELYWMTVEKVSEKIIHYISKGWSIFSSPLVSTGV